MSGERSSRSELRRRLNGRVLAIGILLALAAALLVVKKDIDRKVHERDEMRQVQEESNARRAAEINKSAQGIARKIREARFAEDWRALADKDLPVASKEEQKVFGPQIRLKTFEADFWKAERLLARARSFLSADKNHPVAKKYLSEADALYSRNQEHLANLAEGAEDPFMRARVHYLIGVYYYRSLALGSLLGKMDEFKGADIVEQVITQFDKALELKKLDWATQVAIEILQKNAKQFLAAGGSAGSDAGDMRLRLLPQGEISSPGGGPLERRGGRH